MYELSIPNMYKMMLKIVNESPCSRAVPRNNVLMPHPIRIPIEWDIALNLSSSFVYIFTIFKFKQILID